MTRKALFRQRNEFLVVAGNARETAASQSSLAWSMRSFELETKFHQMCRGSENGSPPTSTTCESASAFIARFAAAIEDDHRARIDARAVSFDSAVDHVNPLIGMEIGKREDRARLRRTST